MEAFPRYLWGPPPPYSQPTSTENIVLTGSPGHQQNPPTLSAMQGNAHIFSSPNHRPPTLADLMRGPGSPTTNTLSSPSDNSEVMNSPNHIPRPPRGRHKAGNENTETLGSSSSLPSRHRIRRLPLGHVKSLGDVTEQKHDESLEVLFCDGKEISSLDKFHSQGDIPHKDCLLSNKHIKSISDPKSVYANGKSEQESELYFADVSSCVSVRQDGEDVLYYSEPTSSASQQTPSPSEKEAQDLNHLYEHVRDREETESHHTSDDTMIVHSSPSENSIGTEMENTYSIVSPLTDVSSTSPMVTDTDAYSCYTAGPSPVSPNPQRESNTQNLNFENHQINDLQLLQRLHHHHHHHRHPLSSSHQTKQNRGTRSQGNDNDISCPEIEAEQCYETIQGDTRDVQTPVSPPKSFSSDSRDSLNSDLNGNISHSQGGLHQGRSSTNSNIAQISRPHRSNLSLPLRRVLSSSDSTEVVGIETTPTPDTEMQSLDQQGRPSSSGGNRRNGNNERHSYHSSEPTTPAERRLHSVHDLLFTLKSVNV